MRPITLLAFSAACAVGFWPAAIVAQTTALPSTVLRPLQTIETRPADSAVKPPVITAVAVVPGGGLAATAGDDHVVRIWNTQTGRIVHTLKGHGDWVRSLAFSPDGRSLASAGDDRQIILWQVAGGKRLVDLPTHPHAVYSLAYSPDGRLLAAAGFEHEVRLYDAANGQLVKELDGPGDDLRSVVFSPDGEHLATGGRNGQIRVWRMPEATIQLEISAGIGRLRTLAYLPDGAKLASAGEGREICIWDASTGEQLQKLNCRSGKVLSMVVCGENLVATGGSDNVVRIWNWQTRSEADRLLGHTGSVATLAFDATSGVIVSGSYDTTVRVWKLRAVETPAGTAAEVDPDSRVR